MNQESNIVNSVWETLYVIMGCFDVKLGHPACESLMYFFDSLTNTLPVDDQKNYLINYLSTNPVSDFANCKKNDNSVEDIKSRLEWVLNLKNGYNKSKGIKEEDKLDRVLVVYNPLTITKRFWGNRVWKFLHYHTLYQPSTLNVQRQYYIKMLMTSLSFLLPCVICRNHLKVHLHEFPISGYLSTNLSLFRWTFILHNTVNKSIGKPVLKYEDAVKLYA